MNEASKKEQQKLMTVINDETGKINAVSQEFYDKANEIDQRIHEDFMSLCQNLYLMRSQKYYIALGYTTWAHYLTAKGISERKGRGLKRIGQKFGGDGNNGKPATSAGFDDPENNGKPALGAGLRDMGYKKLYALSTLPDEEIQSIKEHGYFTGTDGEKITSKDMREMYAKDLEREVAKIKRGLVKKLADKNSTLTHENETLKAEKEQLLDEKEKMEKKIDLAYELEREYGKKARTLQNQMNNLDEAIESVRHIRWLVEQTSLTLDEPDKVLVKARDLYKEYEGLQQNLRVEMAEILIDIENIPDPLDTPEINAALKEAVEKQEAKDKKQ
ncbi:MAG: hypothetical protein ACE5I1_14365 [bacterium]